MYAMKTNTTAISLLAVALLAPCALFADYEKSFTITFPGYKGTTTLTDFPVLVRLSAELNDFDYSKCKVPGGGDTRFFDADGTLLSSEVDTWDASGESLVWVKVPSFTATTNIVCRYGSATPDEVTESDVWSNGYVAVWHLGDANNTTQKDSTAGGHDFVCAAGDVARVDLAATGPIGGAVGFNKDGSKKGGLQANDPENVLGTSLDTTFEFWLYQTDLDTTANRAILSKRTAWNSGSYYFYANKSRNGDPEISPSTAYDNPALTYPGQYNAGLEMDTWKHFTFTRTGADGTFSEYADGGYLSKTTLGGTGGPFYPLGEIPVVLGNDRTTSSAAYLGRIDEVRISNVARSADWIQASRDCVANEGFTSCEMLNDWTKYSRKFTITFSGAPEGTLENFPVLVKISTNGVSGFSYADCVKENGGDLRFADENGTLLSSEVDTWDTNGVSLVWVKVPTLTSATQITAYYGWKFAPAVDADAVWDNGFLGVWHLDETSTSAMLDSTGGGSSLYEESWYAGSVGTGRDGVVGKAVEFNLRTSDHKGGLRTSASRVLRCGQDAMTVEVWAWQDHHDPSENPIRSSLIHEMTTNGSTYPTIYEMYEANSSGNYGKFVALTSFADGSSGYYTPNSSKPLLPRAEWNHVVLRYDGVSGGVNIQNGVTITGGYSNKGALKESLGSSTLFVGCKTTGTANSQFPGCIDEVRVSSVARSDAWIKATYDTIKNNGTFTSYGSVRDNAKYMILLFR